jgi:YidC/Oxa1 family membrane protein insertase
MRLYKEHKVNPLGGCLSLLLQMPVFFALYPVLYSTIEFRAAPFIWWISDLSQPDTIYQLSFSLPIYGDKINVLPVIWTISMFFQNFMTMKDPKQKFMVYLMPIFMLLIFNRLPSGLVLYWTVFNIFSMLQQFLVRDNKGEAAPGTK